MENINDLGWPVNQIGELDHRLLLTPSIKLRSAIEGGKGDVVYSVDLRVRQPNQNEYLSSAELHSVEHFLLEGFHRLLPKHFISVGIMGCQTGFYLIFLNEGRVSVIGAVLAQILEEMATATEVPYANIEQCGHYEDHDLAKAKEVAREILNRQGDWLKAAQFS